MRASSQEQRLSRSGLPPQWRSTSSPPSGERGHRVGISECQSTSRAWTAGPFAQRRQASGQCHPSPLVARKVSRMSLYLPRHSDRRSPSQDFIGGVVGGRVVDAHQVRCSVWPLLVCPHCDWDCGCLGGRCPVPGVGAGRETGDSLERSSFGSVSASAAGHGGPASQRFHGQWNFADSQNEMLWTCATAKPLLLLKTTFALAVISSVL